MSKVAITKTLLDDLADSIANKFAVQTPMTIEEMTDTVDGLVNRTSSDLTASGSTVTVPSGVYLSNAQKGIGLGNATVNLSKGSRINNSILVTPTVITTAGYVNSESRTSSEQAVSVSAAEVTFGNKSITENGSNIDVTEYATVSVAVPATTPTLQTKSATYTPTESQQTAQITADSGYDGLGEVDVTVNAIPSNYVGSGITQRSSSDLTVSGATVTAPSGYYSSNATKTVASGTEGTPTATKGTVSNHSVSVTPSVTNTAGYISGGTHNGTAVSVSASELVSGTLNVTSSGTKDVTNYASASIPSGTAGTPTATKGSVSNHALTVTPSVTNTTGWITGSTINGTGVSVSASELVSGSQTITENDTYDVTNLASVVVNVSGGSSGGMQVGTASCTLSSAGGSIWFTDLAGEPTSFSVICDGTVSTGSPFKAVAVVGEPDGLHAQTITNTSNAQVSYNGTDFIVFWEYQSNPGMFVIEAENGLQFPAGEYLLTYTYGGTDANIGTADVQVGSGATSITFTGLDDEPDYFSCIFKSNFSTSSGYQRVIAVVYDGTDIYGLEMDSQAKFSDTHWSYTYNNGSLTITSQGTNAGGYFHQPGYYQLTYAIGGDQSLQTKTVTPTTSTQNVTADTGYTALKKVVVNPIPSSYVQPTTTVGATTYRASTSNQTIQSGTYHSAAATIAAVTQTNLTAANIKSGTTISISNGQSNLWSVTGTYTGGGGGGSISVATTTWNNSSNTTTSHQFTGLSGTPKFAVLRCTSQLTRSSSNTYYYIADIVWDGTNAYGNYHLRSNGSFNNVTSDATTKFTVTTGTNSITFTSGGSRSGAPGSFYNGTYELAYIY